MSATRKVVINTCFGGFSLSKAACELYAEMKGINDVDFSKYEIDLGEIERDDEALVAVVEQLGKKANASYSKLKVVEIPADVKWQIDEYDGVEHIAEVHRTWS